MEVKNLPERLREHARRIRSLVETNVICREAADEIERLRADNHRYRAILKGSEEDYSYLFEDEKEE